MAGAIVYVGAGDGSGLGLPRNSGLSLSNCAGPLGASFGALVQQLILNIYCTTSWTCRLQNL